MEKNRGTINLKDKIIKEQTDFQRQLLTSMLGNNENGLYNSGRERATSVDNTVGRERLPTEITQLIDTSFVSKHQSVLLDNCSDERVMSVSSHEGRIQSNSLKTRTRNSMVLNSQEKQNHFFEIPDANEDPYKVKKLVSIQNGDDSSSYLQSSDNSSMKSPNSEHSMNSSRGRKTFRL